MLKIDTAGLKAKMKDGTIHLSWPRIDGYHSDVIITQCVESDETSKNKKSPVCHYHDVTNVTELDVASGNGTLLTLTVRQDRDAVFEHQFVFEQDASKHHNSYSYWYCTPSYVLVISARTLHIMFYVVVCEHKCSSLVSVMPGLS